MNVCENCGRENEADADHCGDCGVALTAPDEVTPSVEFLRQSFKSPEQQEFALRCAQFLARIIGDRITLLRPETTWSDVSEWLGPGEMHAALLAVLLRNKFGADTKEFFYNSEVTTFRDFVDYACSREHDVA